MRLMVLGSKAMAREITSALAGQGIEVIYTPDGLQTIALLKKERVDLAAIDASLDDAEVACRCISELFSIPVVLIVSEADADWEKLQFPETDGYIFAGASGAEIAARLQAVVRRWSTYSRPSLNIW